MNNVMPDPISAMGRAVQAKTQGMTPEEVAALDQQYAKMGLMSINDVITMKQQLDYMKQAGQAQQSGPPPSTTVAQDLQQQLGGGISSLPSNVGNEAAYARGGIVSFAGGSPGEPVQLEMFPKHGPRNYVPNDFAAVDDVSKITKAPWYKRGFGPTRQEAWRAVSTKAGAKGLAKSVGKGVGKAAPWLALGSGAQTAGTIWNTDPRYLAAAYGTSEGSDSLAGYGKDTGLRALAFLEDQIPFRTSTLERARAAQDADVIKVRGQDWELQYAEQYRAAKAAGNDVLAERIAEEYRSLKGNKGSGLDLSKYLGEEQNGIAGLAASMGLGGDPYAKADAYMGDSVNALKGLIGENPDRNAEIAAARGRREDANIGDAYAADMARNQEELEQLPKDKERDKWLSAAEGFFKMAEAAGEDGATIWGAAGAGGSTGVAAYNKALDKLEAKEERLRDKQSEIRRYDEQLRMGDITEGSAEYRRLMDRRDNAVTNYANKLADRDKLAAEIAMHEMSIQANLAVAQIQQSGRGREIERLTRGFIDARAAGDVEEASAILGMLKEIQSTLPQVQAADIRSQNKFSFGVPETEDEGAWTNFRQGQ